MSRRPLLLALAFLGAACGSTRATPDASPDAAVVDASPAIDASADASAPDAGPVVGDCLDLPTWTMPPPAASLPVEVKLLSDTPLAAPMGEPVSGYSLIETDDSFAFVALSNLYVYKKDGTLRWKTDQDFNHNAMGDVSADTAGNFYAFVNDKLTSYSPSGAVRWERSFPSSNLGPVNFSYTPNVYKDETVMFLARPTNTFFALDAKTGAIRKEDPVGPQSSFSLIGLHHYLTDLMGHFWDARTLERKNTIASVGGKSFAPATVTALPDGTLFGASDDYRRTFRFDRCFTVTKEYGEAGRLGFGPFDLTSRQWVAESGGFRLVDVAGALPKTSVVSPGRPTLGADGFMYNHTAALGVEVRDANGALVPGISLALPTGKKNSLLMLHDDGVLEYLMWNNGPHRIRIQTKSPGPAKTGNNISYGDYRATQFPIYPGLP